MCVLHYNFVFLLLCIKIFLKGGEKRNKNRKKKDFPLKLNTLLPQSRSLLILLSQRILKILHIQVKCNLPSSFYENAILITFSEGFFFNFLIMQIFLKSHIFPIISIQTNFYNKISIIISLEINILDVTKLFVVVVVVSMKIHHCKSL